MEGKAPHLNWGASQAESTAVATTNCEKSAEAIVAASIMDKDQMLVCEAMKRGANDLGVCYKRKGSSQYDFYISPFKLWQLTRYVCQGDEIEFQKTEDRKKAKKKG